MRLPSSVELGESNDPKEENPRQRGTSTRDGTDVRLSTLSNEGGSEASTVDVAYYHITAVLLCTWYEIKSCA